MTDFGLNLKLVLYLKNQCLTERSGYNPGSSGGQLPIAEAGRHNPPYSKALTSQAKAKRIESNKNRLKI